MAKPRSRLHELLCDILGSRFCYFDPPASIQMRYPCIVYRYENSETRSADNERYKRDKRYIVTIIDSEADSEIADRLIDDKRISYLSSDRNYVMDGLHHFVFTIFY